MKRKILVKTWVWTVIFCAILTAKAYGAPATMALLKAKGEAALSGCHLKVEK